MTLVECIKQIRFYRVQHSVFRYVQNSSHSTPWQTVHPTPCGSHTAPLTDLTLHPLHTLLSTPWQTLLSIPWQTLQSIPRQTLHSILWQTLHSTPWQTLHPIPWHTLLSIPWQTLHSTPGRPYRSAPSSTNLSSRGRNQQRCRYCARGILYTTVYSQVLIYAAA